MRRTIADADDPPQVIDFGSSCFTRDPHSSYVQSRSYRAPEVSKRESPRLGSPRRAPRCTPSCDHMHTHIRTGARDLGRRPRGAWQVVLGLPYSQKVDVWSLGCILAELLTSNVLFCNTSVQTLLAGQIALSGEMPEYMIAEGRHAPRYFCGRRLYLRKPSGEGFFVSPRPRPLRETLGTDDELFLDFMTKMLRLDMNSRISAAEASVAARGFEPSARAAAPRARPPVPRPCRSRQPASDRPRTLAVARLRRPCCTHGSRRRRCPDPSSTSPTRPTPTHQQTR